MLGADPITTVAVAPAAAAPPLPAAALTAAAPLVPPSEERDAGPAAASTTAGAAAAAAAGTVAGGEEDEEEEGLVVIEQGLAEQQRQQGADHLDSRSTGSSEADEDDDDWDLCAELERLDASTTQRPASRTRNSNRSVGRRRRTVHADTATAATTTATTRAPTPPGQWADLGDLLRADDEAASGGDDGDEDGDDDADSTTAASTEADEVWLPGGGGEGSCVFWVYRDSWGNEVPYPPAAQALLEREWRAGRDSAHLLPGLGGVDGETGGHYTVRFAAASDQHVQVNRLTGTQRRVKRLTRLPREPKGVGGLVLALKGKAREVKEMGPGGVSKAALARARAAGRALARRAPEKEAVVEVRACVGVKR